MEITKQKKLILKSMKQHDEITYLFCKLLCWYVAVVLIAERFRQQWWPKQKLICNQHLSQWATRIIKVLPATTLLLPCLITVLEGRRKWLSQSPTDWLRRRHNFLHPAQPDLLNRIEGCVCWSYQKLDRLYFYIFTNDSQTTILRKRWRR